VPITVVVAPDSFKGSLTADEAALAVAAGWRTVRPDDHLVLAPQADGGEGTLDAFERVTPGAQRRSAGIVAGPDGQPTPGEWLQLPFGVAVVELAQSSGLPLMTALDPLGATTRGLGEVIAAAISAGATALVIGLGGSASTDGATGALRALGLRLVDAAGLELPDGGGALSTLDAVVTAQLIAPPPGGVVLLTDVTAPLLGERGAAAVFGPQKGASPAEVVQLDAALARFAAAVGGDPSQPGAGAAGGAGYGFAAVWGATIRPGWEYLADSSGLENLVRSADVLLTGEGRFDGQSLDGKVVGQLLGLARRGGVRAGVIAGQVTADPGVWNTSLVALAGSVEAAIATPAAWLHRAGTVAAQALGETDAPTP